MWTEFEIGPQRLEEVAILIERNAADHIAQRGSEEDGQQSAGNRKDDIKEALPHGIFHVGTKLDSDGTQHQQPQHHHQGQVKATEAGGVELGKREVQGPTGSGQQHSVAIQYSPDRAQTKPALTAILATVELNHTRPE